MAWSPGRSRLAVLGAALLFSTGGAAIKGTSLSAFQVAGFRSGVAGLALLLLFPEARRGFGRDLLPGALCYAATLCTFVIATKLTTSAAAIFLQSTAPIWVLLLSPLLIKEPVRPRDLPYVAAAGVGLALVFAGSSDAAATASNPLVGNLCALASGLLYALLMLFLRRTALAGGPDRTLPATVLGNALAFVSCAPLAFPVTEVSAHDVLSVLYLGVIQIALAYWLFSRALGTIPALEASLLVLVEPVLNPIWTWLLLGERPSTLAVAGGAVMLAALAAKALLERAPPPPPRTVGPD